MSDDSGPVPPTLYSEHRHQFSHKERVDAYLKLRAADPARRATAAQAGRAVAGSQNRTTLNAGPTLTVSELVYPGDRAVRPINKWIYVLHPKNAWVAEAYAGTANAPVAYRHHPHAPSKAWTGGVPANEGFRPGEIGPDDAVTFPIPRKEGEAAGEFLVFLSPWRLTRETLRTLTGSDDGTQCCIPAVAGDGPGLRAFCIDPLAWAGAANNLFYLQVHEAFVTWVLDQSDKVFIASTLDTLMGDRTETSFIFGSDVHHVVNRSDPLQLSDQLRDGEPRMWLRDYAREELRRREQRDAAGLYLIKTCLDTPEFKLVEAAMLVQGLFGLSLLSDAYALSLVAVSQCRPGQLFLRKLVVDGDRLPHRQIFVDDNQPIISWDNFTRARWLWYSSWSIFTELMPAYSLCCLKMGILRLDISQRLENYLLMFGVELEGMETVFRYVAQEESRAMRSFDVRVLVGTHARSILRKGDSFIVASDEPELFGRASYWSHSTETAFKWIGSIAAVGLEAANFLNCLNGLRAEQRKQSNDGVADKAVSLVGGSADGLTMIGNLLKHSDRVAAVAGKAITRYLPILGMISGFCDGYDMAEKWVSAHENGTYAEAIGGALGTAGGSLVVLGSAISLISLTSNIFAVGAWGGPVGLVVAAIGSALLAAGSIVLAAYKLSPYQEFALYCFLGNQARTKHVGAAIHKPWAVETLNAPETSRQARNLLELLYSYRVAALKPGGDVSPVSRLEVRQGTPQVGNVFRIQIVQVFDDLTYTARLLVNTDHRKISIVPTSSPYVLDLSLSEATWSADEGGLRAFSFPLFPTALKNNLTGESLKRLHSWPSECAASVELTVAHGGRRYGAPNIAFWLDCVRSDGLTTLDNQTDAPKLAPPAEAWPG